MDRVRVANTSTAHVYCPRVYSGRFLGGVDSLICLDKVFGMVLLVRLLRERGLLGGAYVLASWLIEPKTPWITFMPLT